MSLIDQFRRLSEDEQFAHWYGTQIGLESLGKAAGLPPDNSSSNNTLREIGRSRFGIINIKRNVQLGREYYHEHS